MGRIIPTGLQPYLDLKGPNTQTTLSLIPVSGPPLHFATDKFTTGGNNYVSNLLKTDEIRQSVFAATDRVNALVENVDKAIGTAIASESLVKAEAIVGRFYRDPANLSTGQWVELFRGQAIPTEVNEADARLEIVNDLAAAGYCVGNWTLAENCQAVYKHAGTCGYAGSEPTCNKKRRSPFGCSGKIVTGTTTNEYRFLGMEYPDVQAPAPPAGGGGGGGVGWGGGSCPRLDQFVLARGDSEFDRVVRLARNIKAGQWLFDPITNGWNRVLKATIVRRQPIWFIEAENGAACYASELHPVLRDRDDPTGRAVKTIDDGEPVLTWSNGQMDDSVAQTVQPTRRLGDVMKIELEGGHIYCAGDDPRHLMVAHNSKPLDPLLT